VPVTIEIRMAFKWSGVALPQLCQNHLPESVLNGKSQPIMQRQSDWIDSVDDT